jgi:peptidyl-prolyl cis-trans isomerase SurA
MIPRWPAALVRELMAQMEDERVNKRAQMYLRDLRRDAIIEYN